MDKINVRIFKYYNNLKTYIKSLEDYRKSVKSVLKPLIDMEHFMEDNNLSLIGQTSLSELDSIISTLDESLKSSKKEMIFHIVDSKDCKNLMKEYHRQNQTKMEDN